GTFAQYSGCLASTSTSRSGRRCRPARFRVVLASSRDFLQGTPEKIYFQGFVCQRLLQSTVFPLQPALIALFCLPFRAIQRSQLITPLVQHRPMHPKLFGQFQNTVAVPHPFHCLLPKSPWILSLSFFHLHSFPMQVSTFCVSQFWGSLQHVKCVRHDVRRCFCGGSGCENVLGAKRELR